MTIAPDSLIGLSSRIADHYHDCISNWLGIVISTGWSGTRHASIGFEMCGVPDNPADITRPLGFGHAGLKKIK